MKYYKYKRIFNYYLTLAYNLKSTVAWGPVGFKFCIFNGEQSITPIFSYGWQGKPLKTFSVKPIKTPNGTCTSINTKNILIRERAIDAFENPTKYIYKHTQRYYRQN